MGWSVSGRGGEGQLELKVTFGEFGRSPVGGGKGRALNQEKFKRCRSKPCREFLKGAWAASVLVGTSKKNGGILADAKKISLEYVSNSGEKQRGRKKKFLRGKASPESTARKSGEGANLPCTRWGGFI